MHTTDLITTLIDTHYYVMIFGIIVSLTSSQITEAFGKYGKNLTNSKVSTEESYFSLTIDVLKEITVSKSYFAYFYWFVSIWHPIVWAFSYFQGVRLNNRVFLLCVLFQLQFVRRWYEVNYVQKLSSKPQMHISIFIFGLSHYFCLALIPHLPSKNNDDSFNILTITCATVLFFWSSYHQYSSHCILASMRKNDGEYSIPEQGYFLSCSSPHYFFEILIYVSFLIIGYPFFHSLWLASGFVLINLSISGYYNHQWYLSNFPERKEFLNQRHFILIRP